MPPLCENPDRYAYHSDGVETNRIAKGRRRGMAVGGETTIARAAAVHNQRLEARGLDQACRAQLMASERAAGRGGQCKRWGQRLGPAGFWVPFLRHIAPQEAALGLWGEDAMPAVVGAAIDLPWIAKDVANACAVKRSGEGCIYVRQSCAAVQDKVAAP